MTGRPSATLIVVSYNHEAYIGAAVDGALAQQAADLEIIFADDASPDRTFAIIQEKVAAYAGPHRIVLHRAARNAGLAANVNSALALATGDVVIMQGGDDISRPDRTAKVLVAFQEPTPVDMVCSRVTVIDAEGRVSDVQRTDPPVTPATLADAAVRGAIGALGCACAYSRSLWTKYGPIGPDVLQEDVVFPFRALLERGIRVIDEPLVDYRVHTSNLYVGPKVKLTRPQLARWSRSWRAILEDWCASWDASGRDDPAIRRRIAYHLKRRRYEAEAYERGPISALALSLRALGDGVAPRHVAGLIKRHVLGIASGNRFW